ncbi:E3 ubiquitin-protein ligase TRIM62-like [Dendrobates tinctorius]|uniref:E3 ubiquitin-protein ligase TRIM62-like n=1 Tax=Dendrobates tinctorius TaxID=92724 RepID=UPI003CC9822D
MASAELRDELNCSICLSLYTDPVSLRCGHNFCRSCIVSVLDAQEAAGGYFCPDCRAEYPERPALEKNQKLRSIMERFSSTQPGMEETRIFCTYCTKSPVPAVKSCLQCEASFCEEHLSRHSKSPEHMLVDHTDSLEERKCSTHKEVLKYYCPIDTACICVSCWVAGDHKGHDVELLDVASEKKEIKPVFETMKSKRKEVEERIQNLKDHGTEQGKKSAGLGVTVALLFTDLRKKLDDLEKRIQGEISRQKDQVLHSVSDLSTTRVRNTELQVDKLTKDMNHLEGLCNLTDPLTFLQDVNAGDISDGSCEVIGDVRDAPCVDEGLVSQILHRGLGSFADVLINMKMKRQFPAMEKLDILLDVDTAHNNIIISQDLRSASYSATSQNRPDGPKRFRSQQVLSSRSFSSGRHYWEVDVSQAKQWIIGVAGESMERNGNQSYIGYNEKSWGLMFIKNFGFHHNSKYTQLASDSPVRVVGIYLDYEAGHLSLYQVCDPIRHLHTVTASFSEPLYAALYLSEGSIIRINS